MAQLDNCPRCGRLFVKLARKVCPQCHQKVEEEFRRVYDFLRKKENRQATIYETSEQTGVSVTQIKEFIRQGRLEIKDFPRMGYPCETCGELIKEGRFCHSCRQQLLKEMATLQESGNEQKGRPLYHYSSDLKGYRKMKLEHDPEEG